MRDVTEAQQVVPRIKGGEMLSGSKARGEGDGSVVGGRDLEEWGWKQRGGDGGGDVRGIRRRGRRRGRRGREIRLGKGVRVRGLVGLAECGCRARFFLF